MAPVGSSEHEWNIATQEFGAARPDARESAPRRHVPVHLAERTRLIFS